MKQPELSIVIPFLNEAKVLPLLRERLEKLADRPSRWELLFVSDGSTDGTGDLLQTIQTTQSRLCVHRHEANRGKGATPNLRLLHARR